MVDRVKPEGFEYFHLRTRSWDGAQGQFWNSDFSVFQYHSSGSGWRSPEGLQIVRYRRDKLISTLRKGFNVNGIVVLVAQDLANSENVFLDEFRIYVGLWPQSFQKFICVTRRPGCSTR